jgi:hypothetical protein
MGNLQFTNLNSFSCIFHLLIPNVQQLEMNLTNFASIIDADEVLLFERATFLVSHALFGVFAHLMWWSCF